MAAILFILQNREAEAQRDLEDLLWSHGKTVVELGLEAICPECHVKVSPLHLTPYAYHLCLHEGRRKDSGHGGLPSSGQESTEDFELYRPRK